MNSLAIDRGPNRVARAPKRFVFSIHKDSLGVSARVRQREKVPTLLGALICIGSGVVIKVSVSCRLQCGGLCVHFFIRASYAPLPFRIGIIWECGDDGDKQVVGLHQIRSGEIT